MIIGNYSINKKIKPTYKEFKSLVGSAFDRVPKKDREKAIKTAYKKEYPKLYKDEQSRKVSKESKEDQSSDYSRKTDSQE